MIYLDYNATTPLAEDVVKIISKTLTDAWQNPSSPYAKDSSGKSVKLIIEDARQSVADMVSGQKQDIIFTSGGTESNNMVFHSMLRHFDFKYGGSSGLGDGRHPDRDTNVIHRSNIPHFVTTNIEHDAVKLVLQEYQRSGKAEVTFVAVSKDTGQVIPEDVMAAIQPNTVLISVMLANNETGVIQPIEEISERLKHIQRGKGETSSIYFHTDAAQAIGKVPVSAQDLGVDYLTIVGHKFYGPRIGALYARQTGEAPVPLYPMFYGGGQERGFRPGTENTPMIAGLGKAAEMVAKNIHEDRKNMKNIRDYFEDRLEETFPGQVQFNLRYPKVPRLPNTSSVSILGEGLQGFQILSNVKYVQASVGAACHAQNRPSPILLASGVSSSAATSAIRVSVGRSTSEDEIDRAVADLKQALESIQS